MAVVVDHELNDDQGSGGGVWGTITGNIADQTDLAAALATAGNTAVWGSITGTLSNQTDLQTALDAKVTGPASATDNAIARFDGTTGKLIQNSAITISDTGHINAIAATLGTVALNFGQTASGFYSSGTHEVAVGLNAKLNTKWFESGFAWFDTSNASNFIAASFVSSGINFNLAATGATRTLTFTTPSTSATTITWGNTSTGGVDWMWSNGGSSIGDYVGTMNLANNVVADAVIQARKYGAIIVGGTSLALTSSSVVIADRPATVITGTHSSNASTTHTLSGGLAIAQLSPGDRVASSTASTVFATVLTVPSNTSFTTDLPLGNGAAGQTFTRRSGTSFVDRLAAYKGFWDDRGRLLVGDIVTHGTITAQLQVSNGSDTNDIVDFKDGTVSKFKIADGGVATFANNPIMSGLTASRLVLTDGSKALASSSFAEADLTILGGRAGGQTLNGDTASGGNLTLHSTAHATKGKIILGQSTFVVDEVNNRLGIGIASPVSRIHVDAGTATASQLRFTANATTGQTATDGITFGIKTNGEGLIEQNENLQILVRNNGIDTVRFNEFNNVSITANGATSFFDGFADLNVSRDRTISDSNFYGAIAIVPTITSGADNGPTFYGIVNQPILEGVGTGFGQAFGALFGITSSCSGANGDLGGILLTCSYGGGGTVNNLFAGSFSASNDSGTATALTGMTSTAANSGTTTAMTAGIFQADNGGGAVATTVCGIDITAVNSGTTTDLYTVKIAEPSNVGSSTNGRTGILLNGTLSFVQTNDATTGTINALPIPTSHIHLSGNPTVNGIEADNYAKFVIITVAGGATFTDQSGSASAANRMINGGGLSVVVVGDGAVMYKRDTTNSRWRLVSSVA